MLLFDNKIILSNDSFDGLNLTRQLYVYNSNLVFWIKIEIKNNFHIYRHLKNNDITNIPSDTFRNQYNLLKLYLQQNYIREIHRGTFRNLISVEWLILENNKIKSLPLVEFETMQSLKYLELTNNRLTLNGQYFPYLKSIYEM